MKILTLSMLFLLALGAHSTNITGFHTFRSKTGPDKPNFLCSDRCLIEEQYDRCCSCEGKTVWELDSTTGYLPVFLEYRSMFGESVIVSNSSSNTFQWLEHSYGFMNGLPDNVCEYNNTLVSIILPGNRILSVEGVNCMWHLDTLDLSDNPISSISNTTFSGMPNLRVLRLVNTQIQILEPNTFIHADTEIFVTDLSNNDFISLDVSNIYSKLRAFCNISLSECNLTITRANENNLSLTESYGGGEILLLKSEIHSGHPFFQVYGYDPDVFKQWPKYKTQGRFTFSEIGINCDCKTAEMLQSGLDVYKKFTYIINDRYICSSPEHLKNIGVEQVFNDSSPISLDMFVCQKQSFCPVQCDCMEQPSQSRLYVDCSNKNLTSLPKYLPQTYYDIELNCSGNMITNVESVRYMDQISILDLSGNPVDRVSESVPSNLSRLERLDLSDHSLSQLINTFKILDAGKVWFGENSISCSCNDQWIEAWRKGGNINESNVLMCKTGSGTLVHAEKAFSECNKVEAFDTLNWLFCILPATMLLGLIIAKLLWTDFLLLGRHLTKSKFQKKYDNDIFILYDEGNSDVLKFVLHIMTFFQEQGFLCFVKEIHGGVGGASDVQLYQEMGNCRSVLAILSLPEDDGAVDEVVLGMNHAWKMFLDKRIECVLAVIYDGKFTEQKKRFPYLGSLNRYNRVLKVRSRQYNIKEKIKQTLPKAQYKDIVLVH